MFVEFKRVERPVVEMDEANGETLEELQERVTTIEELQHAAEGGKTTVLGKAG